MIKVLVTGGQGFIGSYLAEYFSGLHEAYEVKAPGKQELDLTNLDNTRALLMDYRPDAIFHCASVLPGKYSLPDGEIFRLNQLIDTNLLSTLESLKHCKLIYASGTSVYAADTGRIDENSRVSAEQNYIGSKLYGEKIFLESHPESTVLRISAPYGPGQKIKTVLQIFCENAISNQEIKLFGQGRRIQYFTYIQDVAHAFEKAVNADIGGIFNISPNDSVTMLELAKSVISLAGSGSEIVFLNEEENESSYEISNCKAKNELNWFPQTGLTAGLQEVINGYRNIR